MKMNQCKIISLSLTQRKKNEDESYSLFQPLAASDGWLVTQLWLMSGLGARLTQSRVWHIRVGVRSQDTSNQLGTRKCSVRQILQQTHFDLKSNSSFPYFCLKLLKLLRLFLVLIFESVSGVRRWEWGMLGDDFGWGKLVLHPDRQTWTRNRAERERENIPVLLNLDLFRFLQIYLRFPARCPLSNDAVACDSARYSPPPYPALFPLLTSHSSLSSLQWSQSLCCLRPSDTG